MATQGSMSYKDNIACIFGLKQLQSILEIKPEYVSNIKQNIFEGLSQDTEESEEQIIEDVEIDLSEDSNDVDNSEIKDSQDTSSQKSQGYKNIKQPIEFTGFISSCAHGSGRSSTDRQFYFVNSRPCEPVKVIKVINEIYRQYNNNQYPFVFLNITIERTSVDVNVTPDKRKVFLTKEKIILDVLKTSLLKLFECIPRTLKVETSAHCYKDISNEVKPDTDQPRIFNSFLQQFSSKSKKNYNESVSGDKLDKNELKRKSSTMLDFVSSKSMKKADYKGTGTSNKYYNDESFLESDEYEKSSSKSLKAENWETEHDFSSNVKINLIKIESNENDNLTDESVNKSVSNACSNDNDDTIVDDIINRDYEKIKISSTPEKSEVMYLEFSDKLPNTQIRRVEDIVPIKTHTTICKPKSTLPKPTTSSVENNIKPCKVVTDKADLGKYNRKTINLKTSMEQVKLLTDIYQQNKQKIVPERVKFRSAINPVHNKKCEEELSREISKESFKEMVVVGQFNLGFIITLLDDDLFIIDQHATDEIYNFETLQKTTELSSQKLVV